MANPTHGKDDPNPRVQFVGIVTDIIATLVLPCWESIWEEARSADVLVCSSLARPLALCLSVAASSQHNDDNNNEKMLPVAVVHLQPLMPTTLFPHYSHVEEAVQAILLANKGGDSPKPEYEETYWKLEKVQYDFLHDRLEEKCCSMMGISLESFEELRPHLKGENPKTWIVNAFSKHILPSSAASAGPFTIHTGPLADMYMPTMDFEPPQDVLDFFEEGEPPICVGYGSMPVAQASVVREAMEELNVRTILVGSALADGANKKDKILCVESIPYPWLLPRCSMMLSHGGAGVVHATLRAGIPSVISPLMGDQFFWSRLLQAKGLGVVCGTNLATLTKEDIMESITKANACKEACKELGEQIRKEESGPNVLVQKLETFLHHHQQQQTS
eukprot:CAMPEP_0116867678 /NCGR_PEP_ID=MMETSP0418-20121206/26754_1 /TAXON_ID=1158023 /ORGANISM="Astrosyne radiata, Strain 13vi08-1A" /LENGTH=388 /DNA_ID=CAMNT_0004503523 /DNA_START=186 /DNA_END=1352 /DNA_ORIENTATION=-